MAKGRGIIIEKFVDAPWRRLAAKWTHIKVQTTDGDRIIVVLNREQNERVAVGDLVEFHYSILTQEFRSHYTLLGLSPAIRVRKCQDLQVIKARSMPDLELSELQKAKELLKSGQLEQSDKIFAQLIARRYRTFDVYMGRGYCLYKLGKLKKSIKFFYEASFLEPKNTSPIFIIGNIYEELGKRRSAKRMYRKVLALDAAHEEAKKKLNK